MISNPNKIKNINKKNKKIEFNKVQNNNHIILTGLILIIKKKKTQN